MHPIYKKIGLKLREARLAKGWTQQDLAEKTSLTTAFLSYLENGSRKGSLDAYIKIAEALGMTVEALLQGDLGKGFYGVAAPVLSLEGLSASDTRSVKNVVRSLRTKKKKR